MPRHTVREVPSTDLPEHPAVKAWGRLRPEAALPRGAELLRGFRKKAWKRTIYRLEGAGPAGSAVVAKRCPTPQARVERTFYEEILPHLPAPSLRYYGFVEEPGAGLCWLFLEEAGGGPYSPLLGEHRALAGRWLGLLHTAAECVSPAPRLPDRGPGHYLEHLRSARATILGHLAQGGLPAGDVRVLQSIASRCDALESRWGRVERLCDGVPRALVHGDFKAKNLRARTGQAGTALLVFDWETAGWGPPAADLGSSASPDLTAYQSVVGTHWPGLGAQDLQRLAHVGKVFRNLAAIDWAARGLPEGPTGEAMIKLRIYEARQADLLAGGVGGWARAVE
jgi:Phosphotransferase enzyme family